MVLKHLNCQNMTFLISEFDLALNCLCFQKQVHFKGKYNNNVYLQVYRAHKRFLNNSYQRNQNQIVIEYCARRSYTTSYQLFFQLFNQSISFLPFHFVFFKFFPFVFLFPQIHMKIFNFVDTVMVFLIPFTGIVILNSITGYTVWKVAGVRRSMTLQRK